MGDSYYNYYFTHHSLLFQWTSHHTDESKQQSSELPVLRDHIPAASALKQQLKIQNLTD